MGLTGLRDVLYGLRQTAMQRAIGQVRSTDNMLSTPLSLC